MFGVMENEITKYSASGKLHELSKLIDDVDVLLKQVHTSDDFLDLFGKKKATELMIYHIATNGTLRKRFNNAMQDMSKRVRGDIL